MTDVRSDLLIGLCSYRCWETVTKSKGGIYQDICCLVGGVLLCIFTKSLKEAVADSTLATIYGICGCVHTATIIKLEKVFNSPGDPPLLNYNTQGGGGGMWLQNKNAFKDRHVKRKPDCTHIDHNH